MTCRPPGAQDDRRFAAPPRASQHVSRPALICNLARKSCRIRFHPACIGHAPVLTPEPNRSLALYTNDSNQPGANGSNRNLVCDGQMKSEAPAAGVEQKVLAGYGRSKAVAAASLVMPRFSAEGFLSAGGWPFCPNGLPGGDAVVIYFGVAEAFFSSGPSTLEKTSAWRMKPRSFGWELSTVPSPSAPRRLSPSM